MTSLHEIIAVIDGSLKSRTETVKSKLYKVIQKPELFYGFTRTFKPLDEENPLEQLPDEKKLVEVKVDDIVYHFRQAMENLFDAVATKDATNCVAKADIVIGDNILLRDVPVTHLLYLRKQLVDIKTFISKLPTLREDAEWYYDNVSDCYVTPVVETIRTKKVLKNHVRAEATDKFPAQVDTYYEDVRTGNYSKRERSGALPQKSANDMLDRVNDLIEAVDQAKMRANSIEIVELKTGSPLMDYIFA